MLISILVAAAIAVAPVTPPRVVKKIEPQFPNEARMVHESGTVRLKVFVGPDGHVEDVRVVGSAGNGFDQAAVNAVCSGNFGRH